eukprot:4085919-Karenia_brevis.AAC.1
MMMMTMMMLMMRMMVVTICELLIFSTTWLAMRCFPRAWGLPTWLSLVGAPPPASEQIDFRGICKS